MSDGEMEVDTASLHAGADECDSAARKALTAANELAAKKPAAGMFGDFAEARALGEALAAAHAEHVERLHGHHRAWTDIAEKSRDGAHRFTAQDAAGADALKSAGSGFDAG